MKTVQHVSDGEIRRVRDREAMKLIRHGKWRYVKKSLWKAERAGGKKDDE